jgi:spore coat polysaccharide biosynthesis predicted glycosyltransferase SpsG
MPSGSAKSLTPAAAEDPALAKFTPHVDCPAQTVWFRTTASPGAGFGHLRRSLLLARALEGSADILFVIDPDDHWTATQTAAAGWRSITLVADCAWPEEQLPEMLLVDTREASRTHELVVQARNRGIAVVSIHDLGLNPLPSDIVIDGSISPAHTGFEQRSTLYSGTQYLILDPEYADLHQLEKRIATGMDSVFVNLGGGDSRRYFEKILEGLRLWGRDLEVTAAPGFSSWGQKELASRDWRPLRFRWAGENEHLPILVFHADLAITAGGLSLYEAMSAGTPALALSYDAFQQVTVSGVGGAGACVGLGRGDLLRPAQLPRILTLLEHDVAGRTALSARGRELVDGRGLERVCRIVQLRIGREALCR